jgi:hypothetical protein
VDRLPGPEGQRQRTSAAVDDETFLAFITNNAPGCDLETLRRAVQKLNESIAARVFGKPAGLEIGSHIEATDFDGSYYRYGTVIKLSQSGCVIEPPSSRYTDRISFKKQIVRILDEFEWNRACFAAEDFKRRLDQQTARENKEFEAAREQATSQRSAAKRIQMQALNGPVTLFRGAFVYAFRPDEGMHSYGIVIDMTPKNIILSSPDMILGTERITVAKHEITPLDEVQWQRVDEELRRRKDEYERAESDGTTDTIRDYSGVAISVALES